MLERSQQITELCHLPGCHEPFSAVSHLVGAVIFLYLGAMLLRRGAGDWLRLIFLGVYAVSCVLLFTMSALYHMMERGYVAHQVFERLDHSAIFLLVAGTFTPIHGILFRGWLRWGTLIVIWTAAIAGITLKAIFFESLPEWLGLSSFLALGWVGIFGALMLARQFGMAFIAPIVLGGLAYSLGAIMDYGGWPILIPGWVHSHDVFHVCVLFGAILHWRFIWRIARGNLQTITAKDLVRSRVVPQASV
jgi:hemolysin III